jgi:hypothetical protein
MKIDRDRIDDDRRPALGTTLAVLQTIGRPSVGGFASALLRHRQQAATQQPESSRNEDVRSRRTTPRTATRPEGEQQIAGRVPDVSLPGSALTLVQAPRLFPAAAAPAECGAGNAGAPAIRETRRRGVDGAKASPCIEVRHSKTGVRFLLSREDGVWLLSLQSLQAPDAMELAALVEALRTHFGRQGLGPVDLIVDQA